MAVRMQRDSLTAQDVGLSSNSLENDSKNRKSYTLDFKRQVINFYHAHAGNITLSAKMFGVDRKMVRSWVEQQDFFCRPTNEPEVETGSASSSVIATNLQLPPAAVTKVQSVITSAGSGQRKRLERTFSSGSSARYPELEKSLSDWWFSQTNRGLDIKAKDLKDQALKLYQELYPYSSDQEFKASTGWLQRFITRMENVGVPEISQKINGSNNGNGGGVIVSPRAPYLNIAPRPAKTQNSHFRLPEALSIPNNKRSTPEDKIAPPKRSRPILPDLMRNSQHIEQSADQPEVKYSSMSDSDRNAMERQNQDADKFFQDCHDFLIYLEKVSRDLAKYADVD